VYVGETWRSFETIKRKKHVSKVRLAKEDTRNGKLIVEAEERMEKEDGGLASYSVNCKSGINCGKKRK
jgi:hypothetical protein